MTSRIWSHNEYLLATYFLHHLVYTYLLVNGELSTPLTEVLTPLKHFDAPNTVPH